MNISYEYYRVFYYVAKYRSFTLAANALLSNQPNVTRTVRNLEQTLGCTLFVRSNRGVTLTPEGEKLWQHVRIAVEHFQAGEEAVSAERSLQSGAVRIGVSEIALYCVLLPALDSFHRLYPNIRLRITSLSTPETLSALKSGAVELALVTMPSPLRGQPRGLTVKPLCTVQEAAVCGEALAEAAEQPRSPAELAAYPLVSLSQNTQTYGIYAEWFMQHGVSFAPEIEVSAANQILPMVRHGLGIGFVPEHFLREHDPGGVRRLTVTEPLPSFCICILRRADDVPSIAAKELERTLEQSILNNSGERKTI